MFSFFKKLFGKKDNVDLVSQFNEIFNQVATTTVNSVQTEQEEIPSYFTDKEFACKDGCGDSKMDPGFVDMLNKARHIAGKPWRVNSGKRCVANNKASGGVKGSAHTKGMAVDISAPNGAKKYEIVKAAMEAGFTRIGIGKSFVHLDNDITKPQNTIWLY